MLTKNNLYKIIEDSKQLNSSKIVPRNKEEKWLKDNVNTSHIKILTGFRRVGKSFLLKKLSHHLVENLTVPEENIFFINFEHPLIINYRSSEELYNVFETFLNQIDPKYKVYLFLDEVQTVQSWENFVRILHEKGKNKYNIYITGSNSSLLSSEFSSALGGRTVELKIYPFDFNEVLIMNDLKVKSNLEYVKNISKVEGLIDNYIRFGGFPEVSDYSKPGIGDYIEGIVNKVLLDDVIKRYSLDKAGILKDLFRYIVTTTSNLTNASSLQNKINDGQRITSPTIDKYISCLESAFAVKGIARFDWKNKSVFDRLMKYYPIDNSFIEFYSLDKSQMLSRNIESIVFNMLNRCDLEIWYGRDTNSGKEIDFIIKDSQHKLSNIQVSWELNDDNEDRELRNFAIASKHIKGARNILIVRNGNEVVHNVDGLEVEQVPLWKFLIDYKSILKN